MHFVERAKMSLRSSLKVYQSTHSLRIGFHVDDGIYPVTPACKRAVLMAKRALEARGHTVVNWRPPRHDFLVPAITSCFNADAGKGLKRLL